MADLNIFQPYGSTSMLTNVASASVQLPGTGSVCRIFNNSTFPVFIKFGDSTVAATANDVGIPAGAVESFSIVPNKQSQLGIIANAQMPFIAAISPGGAGSISITTGEGA